MQRVITFHLVFFIFVMPPNPVSSLSHKKIQCFVRGRKIIKQNSSSEIECLPFDVLQLTMPNHPSFSCPSRVSTIKPHSITAQKMRDSSGPNHFDSRNFCTATELPNDLMWLLLVAGVLVLFVWNGWFDDVHHLIWPMTVFARERGFASIFTSDLDENMRAAAYQKCEMQFFCQQSTSHLTFLFQFYVACSSIQCC